MKFCTECGTQLNDDSVFCSNCGAKQEAMETSHDTQKVTKENSSIKKEPTLFRTIQCIGATTFNLDRKLYIYNDRMTLMKDSLEVIFECYYNEIKCLKTGGIMAPTFLTLELNNGMKYKFKLNGNDFSMLKVAKELPSYIDSLINAYKENAVALSSED